MALMGFRFHKRIRILKGLYVNLGSKKGPSVSVGGHGVTRNISGRGVHETFSLPGTGISYRTQNRALKAKGGQGGGCGGCASLIVLFLIVGSCSTLFAPKGDTNASTVFPRATPLSTPELTPETAPSVASAHVNLIDPSSEPVPHAKSHQLNSPTGSSAVRVWVDTKTGVYHYPGTRRYGNTKSGEYMSEQDAIKEGDRAARNGP